MKTKTRERVVAVISRARTAELRVVRCSLGDAEIVDVRLFVAQAGGAPCPTLKGIALRVSELPAMIEALTKAKDA